MPFCLHIWAKMCTKCLVGISPFYFYFYLFPYNFRTLCLFHTCVTMTPTRSISTSLSLWKVCVSICNICASAARFKCSVLFFPHVFLICPGEGMQEAATICKSNFKVGDCFAFVLCSHIAVSRVTNSHWQLLLYPFGYTWISLEKLQICKKCIEEVTNILHKYSDCQQDKKQQRTDNAGQIKMLKICSDHPLIPIEIIFIPAEIIFGVSFFP